jgi:cell division protease FtsH
MGGRIAEELVFHQRTNGASNDIEKATDLSRKMVCEWGMSDKLGPLTFGQGDHEVFLGRDMGTRINYSDETSKLIDQEIKDLVQRNYDRAQNIINENRDALDRLAEALLEYEVLEREEIENVVAGKPIVKKLGGSTPTSASKSELKRDTEEEVSPAGTPEPVMGFVIPSKGNR